VSGKLKIVRKIRKKLWNFKIREIGGNPVMNFDLERR